MNRSRLEPLGVPGSDYGFDEPGASRHEPSSADRWLLRQINTKLGASSPVRAALWDERDVTPRDGAVRVRILDRKALWQLVVNPDLHFGDLYSSGRIQVRGDLLTLLLEAYRYTSENTAIGSGAGARPEARAGSVRLEAQHPPPLRHRQRLLQAVARSRSAAIHLRLLRRSEP